jgi:hypothetical protein
MITVATFSNLFTKNTHFPTEYAILITNASWCCHQGLHILPILLNSEMPNTLVFTLSLGNYRHLKLEKYSVYYKLHVMFII